MYECMNVECKYNFFVTSRGGTLARRESFFSGTHDIVITWLQINKYMDIERTSITEKTLKNRSFCVFVN